MAFMESTMTGGRRRRIARMVATILGLIVLADLTLYALLY